MHVIYIYLLIALIGLIYYLISLNRLVYINAPDDVINSKDKFIILKGHIITSIILGIILINVIIKNYRPDYYKLIGDNEYLLISMIISSLVFFFIIGASIQLFLLKSHPYFHISNAINQNPDLVKPDFHYNTTELLVENEFWEVIQHIPIDIKNKKQYGDKLAEFFNSKEPIWLVKFHHSLLEHKLKLLVNGLAPVYEYVFRKYDLNLYDSFDEYIIAHGKTKFNSIIENTDNISQIKINIPFIYEMSIGLILSQIFSLKTGKILIPIKDFDVPENIDELVSKKINKQTHPLTYLKYD